MIVSRPSTQAYRNNWERLWGIMEEKEDDFIVTYECVRCEVVGEATDHEIPNDWDWEMDDGGFLTGGLFCQKCK